MDRLQKKSEQYEGLKADLEANGQLLPILVDGEQRVVDGRHRLRALEELGFPPWIQNVDEALGEEVTNPSCAETSAVPSWVPPSTALRPETPTPTA